MKLQLSNDLISEIAERIDSGENIYIDLETTEILGMPGSQLAMHMGSEDLEQFYGDIMTAVEENPDRYLKIETLYPAEAAKIMRRFAQNLDNEGLADKLWDAMSGRKAFRRFREVLNRNGHYLQEWYAFKQMKIEQHVRALIELHNERQDKQDS